MSFPPLNRQAQDQSLPPRHAQNTAADPIIYLPSVLNAGFVRYCVFGNYLKNNSVMVRVDKKDLIIAEV